MDLFSFVGVSLIQYILELRILLFTHHNISWITQFCNDDVDVDGINNLLIDQLLGQLKEFNSADKQVIQQGVDKLKIGCPLMILCNLNPSDGVCNKTHAILTNCTHCILEVKLLGGDHNGKKVLIPCIIFKLPEEEIGFHMERRQFPVRLAFSMTINKIPRTISQECWVGSKTSSLHTWPVLCCSIKVYFFRMYQSPVP